MSLNRCKLLNINGRGERIRTSDLLITNQLLAEYPGTYLNNPEQLNSKRTY